LLTFSVPLASVVGVLAFVVSVEAPLHDLWLKNFFYNRFFYQSVPGEDAQCTLAETLTEVPALAEPLPDVERHMSRYRAVDIVTDEEDANHFSLHLDGYFQFSSRTFVDYHEHFVHVPAALYRNPMRNVLVLGGGDGLAVAELLKYTDAK